MSSTVRLPRNQLASILTSVGFKSTEEKLGSIHSTKPRIYCAEIRPVHRALPLFIEVRIIGARVFARFPTDLAPDVFSARLLKFLRFRATPLAGDAVRRHRLRKYGKLLPERASKSVKATDMLVDWRQNNSLGEIYNQAL